MIRPAKEMSRVPTLIPPAEAKCRMIGNSDAEAICGASSTLVKMMSGTCGLAIAKPCLCYVATV